jgi:glycosyltransferase involved in cell wall biosynthesis
MNGRLRLLLVTDAVGGVWVYSLELARALEPMGIDVVLAVMGPSPSEPRRAQAAGIKLIDTGLPLDWLESDPGTLRHAGEAIASIATAEGVDLVQTCSAALLAEARFDQPCIAVQHSCVASWWDAVKGGPLPSEFVWRRNLVQKGLRRAAAVVAPSIAFAAETARIYDLAAPVLAVHNGRSSFLPGSMHGDFVFTASRLWDEGKNVATLDCAAAALNVPIEAAGQTVGPNGVTVSLHHLRCLGELGDAQVQAILAARPVFASAALYEPFGLSVLEAANAGCALVLSDIATHREIWGGAAIFVPPRDGKAFASAIRDLLDDPDERQQWGQLARARAQLYTPERMARAMADLYAGIATPRIEIMPMELASTPA